MTPDTPFAPTIARQFFLETAAVVEVLRRLDQGLGSREPFLILTGDPGIGKTAIANEAIARWGSRVKAAYIAYPALDGAELIEEIVRRFGMEPPDGASRSRLLASFERTLASSTTPEQVAVLVIDDAHRLTSAALEDLRLLANAAQQSRRPFEVLLLGLPSLDRRLDEPEFLALQQRASMRVQLEPLSPADTRRYVHHRIAAAGGDGPSLFSRKTCRDIAARTGGVPRQINALAAEALRAAWGLGDQTVSLEHVHVAAALLGGFAPMPIVEDDNGDAALPAPWHAAPPASAPRPAAPSPAQVTPPRPNPAPAAAPAPALSQTTPSRPVTAPAPGQVTVPNQNTPEPSVVGRSPAPTHVTTQPAAGSSPRDDDLAAPPLPPPQEPQEWVKRFVGEKGPVQIGSKVAPEQNWAPLPEETPAEDAPPRFQGMVSKPRSGTRKQPMPRIPTAAITAGLGAIVVIGVLVFVIRAGIMAGRRGSQNAAVSTSAAPQRGVAPVASETQPAASAGSRRSGPYTLEVGTYADFQTASDERDRVSSLTGFEGWVVPAAEGGPYRVMVGAYRNEERAQSSANHLLRSRTLPSVTVVPLPPKETRQ